MLLVGFGTLNVTQPVAAANPGANIIRSGDARFEVLSPTLIRMEYAGNGVFTDAATFNVIGRDGFGATQFTSTVVDGWLLIDTDRMKMSYRVGSGPFTQENVRVVLENAGQRVVAAPEWASSTPTCAIGVLCEAEEGSLGSVKTAADHGGFTGPGFVAGFEAEAASTSYSVTVPTTGAYDLAVRYANAVGGDNQTTQRTLGVAVDGQGIGQLQLPVTGDWTTWSTSAVTLNLEAGSHTIMVVRGARDSGMVNLDSLALGTPGSAYPAAPNRVPGCVYGTVCDAEVGALTGGAVVMNDHNNAAQGSFVAGLQSATAGINLTFTDVPIAGRHTIQLRYANYRTGDEKAAPRTLSVSANGGAGRIATLPPTSNWDAWRTVALPIDLRKGDNRVTIGCPAADSCHLNLDTVAAAATGAAIMAPHAPLSGYRRGLDNIDGPASLTPGLLYEDGWSLLDDTASATFDQSTDQLGDRPSNSGKPYQDGYVFGYGTDYQQALHDLTTLTGPTALLPRWAYGVWYSKYHDYTADDYQNDVIPNFRRHGVPLDVLVTDTDFKAPDTWDGWQFDTQKFPDPRGFLDWSASQGLQNTMNIHPSVVSNDPQYARAQQTAKNKLTKNNEGCYTDTTHVGDCYVFDWSDPDQLKSYLELHQEMETQGVDFWWLDWCCEQSKATYPGVTPDAWINHQYAQRATSSTGRGFVLSRAFGSLQSGGYGGPTGVPTGPWADKRSTVHFTGDTASTWSSLEFQVGYTAGQAATTGLSAISHDIGGFNANRAKIAEDLYVRWVQLGAFQPILRLHGNHSERLPWEYGEQARIASTAFLNLRENLVPLTYSLARQATDSGIPVVRPTYLEYPGRQDAFAAAGGQYFYGPSLLVAPITSPGTSATTSVWFPPGTWTDYFTGKTYTGPSTAEVTADWNTMPVFLKAGGIIPQRGHNVTNDVQHPLDDVLLTVAGGANGSFSLYEDDGKTGTTSATTKIAYTENGGRRTLTVNPAAGSFPGQSASKVWSVAFTNAPAPKTVQINAKTLPQSQWEWNPTTRTLKVAVGSFQIDEKITIRYQ